MEGNAVLSLPYRVLSPANHDVYKILTYLVSEVSPKVALAFERDLRVALDTLSLNPGLGHRREDLTAKPVLYFAIYPYLLIYEITDLAILLHAVLHSARDVSRILERRRI